MDVENFYKTLAKAAINAANCLNYKAAITIVCEVAAYGPQPLPRPVSKAVTCFRISESFEDDRSHEYFLKGIKILEDWV